MVLYFASQGAGRLLWTLALSAALAAFGLMNAGAVAGGALVGPIAWPRMRLLVREGKKSR